MELKAKTRLLALTQKQKKLDINGDGKIDGEDLKKVREGELAATAVQANMDAKQAGKFIVDVFSKNGLKVSLNKSIYDNEGDTHLSFTTKHPLEKGTELGFSFSVKGKEVIFGFQDFISIEGLLSSVIDVSVKKDVDLVTLNKKFKGTKKMEAWANEVDDIRQQVQERMKALTDWAYKFYHAVDALETAIEKNFKK